MVKPMLKAFESAFDTLKGVFNYASTAKEHQSETEIIKDRRGLKEASNIAEDAFKLIFKYYDCLSVKDRKKLKKLYDKFLEHN